MPFLSPQFYSGWHVVHGRPRRISLRYYFLSLFFQPGLIGSEIYLDGG